MARPLSAGTALFTLTGLVTAMPFSLMATPAGAHVSLRDDAGVEAASRSQLASVSMPDGTYRTTNREQLDKFTSLLQKAAQVNNGKIGQIEVLIWMKDNAATAKRELPQSLKDAGFSYVASESFDSEVGHVTPIGAAHKNEKGGLLGMWIETEDGNLLLCWGKHIPEGSSAAEESIKPDSITSRPAPATETTSEARSAGPLQGTWSWTTISDLGHRDRYTNQVSMPGGMSAKFTFLKNGRYKFFFYVRQQTYSLVSEATTNTEGTVKFNHNGTFVLYPSHGHYKGLTGSKVVDRDQTVAERKPTTYYYEWRTENGKRNLYIGPSKTSLSHFKPE